MQMCQWLPGQDHMEWPECNRPMSAFRPRATSRTPTTSRAIVVNVLMASMELLFGRVARPQDHAPQRSVGSPIQLAKAQIASVPTSLWGKSHGKVQNVADGLCHPAPCNFQYSNEKDGPECACAYGYEEIAPVHQTAAKDLYGICDPIPCEDERSNHQDGPGCRCADGYNGTVQLGTVVKNDVSKLFSEPGSGPAVSHFTVFKADSCVPAKCAVENTIGDGQECRCQDGYQGSVTWMGPNAVGACKPAHCSIENSNRKPGLECRCLDGYGGSISTHVESGKTCLTWMKWMVKCWVQMERGPASVV